MSLFERNETGVAQSKTGASPFLAITLAAGRLSEALRRDSDRYAVHRAESARASRDRREGQLRVS